MPFDQATFDAALQEFANQQQVHIKGTATPVDTEVDAFDITATATPAPAASTDGGSSEQAGA
jgi:hypothetical protein